jgi:hypothetical protein
MGWETKTEKAFSHVQMIDPDFPEATWAFRDDEEIGPRMMVRLPRQFHSTPNDALDMLPYSAACSIPFVKSGFPIVVLLAFLGSFTAIAKPMREASFTATVRQGYLAISAAAGPNTEYSRIDTCLVEFRTGRQLFHGEHVWLFWTARCHDQGNGKIKINIFVRSHSNAPKSVIARERDDTLLDFWAKVKDALTGARR